MALLLLRHALTIGNGDDDDDDASTFFSVSRMWSLCALEGYVFPCGCNLKQLLILDSFFYCGLLVFFSHATLWPGLSVFYNVEGKDRLVDSLVACFSFLFELY